MHFFVHKQTWSSANLSKEAIGSPPGDRTKMRAAQLCESRNALPRSNGGGSMNFLPNVPATNPCTAGTTYKEQVKKKQQTYELSEHLISPIPTNYTPNDH